MEVNKIGRRTELLIREMVGDLDRVLENLFYELSIADGEKEQERLSRVIEMNFRTLGEQFPPIVKHFYTLRLYQTQSHTPSDTPNIPGPVNNNSYGNLQ